MWGYSSYACGAHPGTLASHSSVGGKYKEIGKGRINSQVSYCLRLFPLTITECLGWGNSYRAGLFRSMVSRDRKAKNRMPASPSCVRTLCCSHGQTLERELRCHLWKVPPPVNNLHGYVCLGRNRAHPHRDRNLHTTNQRKDNPSPLK